MNISISIVIPTYKRKENLLKLLKSLVDNEVNPTQIVVVEQVENYRKIYKKFAKKHEIPLTYCFLSKPRTAEAMNKGAKFTRSEYVLFLDDDVIVHKGLLEAHLQNFKDSKVAATVGRSLTRGQVIQRDRTDTGRITSLGGFTDGFSSQIRQEVDTVIGCNTCWRRNIYLALGGMDEQFTGNALRLESDLSLRAKNEGYKIIFEPEALVDHRRAETGGARKTEGRLQWYFDFFSNEVYFFLKHRSVWLLPVFLLTRIDWTARCMFGFGREVSIRSMTIPFAGIMDGFCKYRVYLNTYEHRR